LRGRTTGRANIVILASIATVCTCTFSVDGTTDRDVALLLVGAPIGLPVLSNSWPE
jgi:hypothetical protein